MREIGLSWPLHMLDIDEYGYSSLSNDVSFSKPGSKKLIAYFGYGRTLETQKFGNSRTNPYQVVYSGWYVRGYLNGGVDLCHQ